MATIVAAVFNTLLLGGAAMTIRKLRPTPSRQPESLRPRVSVVISARNEADSLEDCLKSVLRQSVVQQVILIDDHSDDETPVVAQRMARCDARIQLIENPTVADGWVAKSCMLHTGAQAVRSPFILFTDADVILDPEVVGDAVRVMESEHLDHLSGHFHVKCGTLAEHVCAPFLVCLSAAALFSTAGWLGSATGAFNLVRTVTYHQHGGHSPIKAEIVDDVALARHLRQRGARARFVSFENRVRVRLFRGLSGFITAVSRSAIPFLNLGSATAAFLALLFMGIVFWTVLAACTGLASVFIPAGTLPLEFAGPVWLMLLPYLLGLGAVWITGRFSDARRVLRLLYPVAALLLGYAVLTAAIARIRGRPVHWRGRSYSSQRRPQTA